MTTEDGPFVLANIRDQFGFPVQLGLHNILTFHGNVKNTLYLDDGMTMIFKLYVTPIAEDTVLVAIMVDAKLWFEFSLTKSGEFFVR